MMRRLIGCLVIWGQVAVFAFFIWTDVRGPARVCWTFMGIQVPTYAGLFSWIPLMLFDGMNVALWALCFGVIAEQAHGIDRWMRQTGGHSPCHGR